MNRARMDGEWLRFLGILKECLGRWSGNRVLRAHGERDRWMGRMEVSYAIVRGTPLLRSASDSGPVRQNGRPTSAATAVAIGLKLVV
jgi:uncharacterized protein YjbJ (UPF0337 family)